MPRSRRKKRLELPQNREEPSAQCIASIARQIKKLLFLKEEYVFELDSIVSLFNALSKSNLAPEQLRGKKLGDCMLRGLNVTSNSDQNRNQREKDVIPSAILRRSTMQKWRRNIAGKKRKLWSTFSQSNDLRSRKRRIMFHRYLLSAETPEIQWSFNNTESSLFKEISKVNLQTDDENKKVVAASTSLTIAASKSIESQSSSSMDSEDFAGSSESKTNSSRKDSISPTSRFVEEIDSSPSTEMAASDSCDSPEPETWYTPCFTSDGRLVYMRMQSKVPRNPEWVDGNKGLERKPSAFDYHLEQRTLICCECDFSFTRALINKRGGGANMCSTALYDYQSQWMGGIRSLIGSDEFYSYINNWKFCKTQCRVTFGIDATDLTTSLREWNDSPALHQSSRREKFDRILYTFPRIYHQSWQKWEYNHHNTTLIKGLLRSCLEHLEIDGEIHHLMFRGQYYHWWIRKTLDQLGMELAYWCKMDVDLLNRQFPGYAARDIWGNSVNLNEWTVYLCAFRRKKIPIARPY